MHRVAIAALAALAFAAIPVTAQDEDDSCLKGLASTVNGDGTITLRWEPPAVEGVTGYQVLMRPMDGSWAPGPQVAATTTTWTDIGATANVTYEYTVIVLVEGGQGDTYCSVVETAGNVIHTMGGGRKPTADVPFFPSALALVAAIVCVAGITLYLVKRK